MKKRPYADLWDYMERTGTSAVKLAQMTGIGEAHMRRICTRSRKCSLEKALILARVTGVSVENLLRGMVEDPQAPLHNASE